MSSSDNPQTSMSLCLLIPGAAARWRRFIGDTSTGSKLFVSSSDGKLNISGERLV